MNTILSAYMRSSEEKGYISAGTHRVSVFDGTKNYSPHSIVVTKINSVGVFFHDPGLPPEPDRKASRKKFSKAMRYGELILIKNPEIS